ncbi:MAG: response regulator [Polyangiaceae bacterium]
MRYRFRLLAVVFGLLAIFVVVLAAQYRSFAAIGASMNDLAASKYSTEVMIRESEVIVASLHGDILNALVFAPEDRGPMKRRLDRDALAFGTKLHALEMALPASRRELFEVETQFRSYYVYASALLDTETLEGLERSRDAIEKFKENKQMLFELFGRISNSSRKNFEGSLRAIQASMLRVQTWSAAFAGALLLLGLPLVLFLTGRLVKPIEHVIAAARRLTGADFSVRIPELYGGEVGTLASAFNLMAERLQENFARSSHEIEVRKASEARERYLQERLAGVMEALPFGLAALGRDGAVALWNQGAREITGLPPSAVEGKVLWEVVPAFAKYASLNVDALGAELGRDRLVLGGRVLEIMMLPFASRSEPGILFRMVDITELERRESQLRQLQKVDTVGMLAGGLAHDFNNVLGVIAGAVSLMEQGLERQCSVDELRRYLEVIQLSSNRATAIIRQLLSLARKDEAPVHAQVDLRHTLERTLELARGTFDRSIEVAWKPSPEAAFCLGDVTQLEQAFLNIFINAAHAMTIMRARGEPFGGSMTVAIAELHADAVFCNSHPGARLGPYWQVSVRDSGVGMDASTLENVFEPFFTTKDKGVGSGLGLAMVSTTIKQHHGFIEAYSEPGVGTSFEIYLPGIVAGRQTAAASPPIVTGQGTILVVDDEELLRTLTARMLERCGFKVLVAADGVEGLEAYRAHASEIVLVLLDMSMPRKGGRETFLELKREFPAVRVLMTSGFGNDDRLVELRGQGIMGVLEKPFGLQVLSAAIAKALAGSSQPSE